MTKREKLIKGLECHWFGFCFACPYADGVRETTKCTGTLLAEAIDVLKHPEQWEKPEEVKQ